MKNYVILFREKGQEPFSTPLGFQCWADDTDHAEEQCVNAYPECDVLWAWVGPEGVGIDPALQDYYGLRKG